MKVDLQKVTSPRTRQGVTRRRRRRGCLSGALAKPPSETINGSARNPGPARAALSFPPASGGSPEARITAESRLKYYRTARSAFPAVLLDLAGPCRESGKTELGWRDFRGSSEWLFGGGGSLRSGAPFDQPVQTMCASVRVSRAAGVQDA